jgi:hypothetical protein
MGQQMLLITYKKTLSVSFRARWVNNHMQQTHMGRLHCPASTLANSGSAADFKQSMRCADMSQCHSIYIKKNSTDISRLQNINAL